MKRKKGKGHINDDNNVTANKKDECTKKKIINNGLPNNREMTISVNQGIGMRGNDVGSYPKQKVNVILHSIVATSLFLSKENLYFIY